MKLHFCKFFSLVIAMEKRIKVLWISCRATARQCGLSMKTWPGTPLRVLCIAAFDAIHEIRYGLPLSKELSHCTAHFLLVASAQNAIHDNKPYSKKRLASSRQFLADCGLINLVENYMAQLEKLEKNRPANEQMDLDKIRYYREQVVYLSIETICKIGLNRTQQSWHEECLYRDPLIACIFRLAMLFQVADDIFDVGKDQKAHLPTFMTATCADAASSMQLKELIRSYSTDGLDALSENWLLRQVISVMCWGLESVVSVFRLRPGWHLKAQQA